MSAMAAAAASCSFQVSGIPSLSLNEKFVKQSQLDITARCSSRHSGVGAMEKRLGSRTMRFQTHIVSARRPGTDRNGGVAQAVEEVKILEDRCSLRHSGAVERGLGSRTRSGRSQTHIVGARRPGKDRNGGLAQVVEEVKIPEDAEPDDMYMGRKLEGTEPDFWEGEQWNTFGFLVQYLWAFGVVISLVACGVAVASYNSGATDIRDTDVFKEALENQQEADPSLEADNEQAFPEVTEAPPLS